MEGQKRCWRRFLATNGKMWRQFCITACCEWARGGGKKEAQKVIKIWGYSAAAAFFLGPFKSWSFFLWSAHILCEFQGVYVTWPSPTYFIQRTHGCPLKYLPRILQDRSSPCIYINVCIWHCNTAPLNHTHSRLFLNNDAEFHVNNNHCWFNTTCFVSILFICKRSKYFRSFT